MSIRKISIASLLVVVAGTVIYWSLRRVDVEPKAGELISLTQTEETMLRTWRGDPEKAKVVGAICLKHSLPKKQIIELIGTPLYVDRGDNIDSIGYSFAPSQVLSFYFDQDGNTIHVEGPGIEFLSHYDRNWNFIRLGMTKKEVNTKLGYNQKELDGGQKWQFHDPTNDPHLYNIYFDENDIVIKFEKTEVKKE